MDCSGRAGVGGLTAVEVGAERPEHLAKAAGAEARRARAPPAEACEAQWEPRGSHGYAGAPLLPVRQRTIKAAM